MAILGRSKQEPATASYSTYLSGTSTIIGNLVLQNATEIDGKVEGDIVAMGHLIIGETAEITAQVEAPSVMVLGAVNGDIKAKRIEVRAPARIAGNLISTVLVFEAGALLNGRCFMSLEVPSEDPANENPELVVLEEPVDREEEPPQQGISFFITKRQRADLRARGYDDATIDKMTPGEAHKILGLV